MSDPVPVAFAGQTTFSTESREPGSRFTFCPIPAHLEVLSAVGPDGLPWVLYVWDTPQGRSMYAVPEQVAREHLERLGEVLGKPRLHIASDYKELLVP